MEKTKIGLYKQAYIKDKRTIFDHVKSTNSKCLNKYLDIVSKLQSIGCKHIAVLSYKLGKGIISGVKDKELYTVYTDDTLSIIPITDDQYSELESIWQYHKEVC